MSVCPFCKAPVKDAHGPCPSCGRLANDHPSISAIGGRNLSNDFDDDVGGDLDLAGGSVGHHGDGSANYGGGGMSFDDDLLDDGPRAGDLELDVPVRPSGAHSVPDLPVTSSKPSVSAARISGSHPAAGASISGSQPAAARSAALPASAPRVPVASEPEPATPPLSSPDPRIAAAPPILASPRSDPAAEMIARYPPPPEKMWQAPVYACKVLWRQIELRQDLESLRRRRSPDVALYERALRAHDRRSFTIGTAVVCAAIVIATILFFMPVILRFANAPD